MRASSFSSPGDFLEGQFAYPGTKKEDFLESKFAYPGKEGRLLGLPGGPVCLSRGQRRRTSWRASLLIPETKKEDFLEGQFAYPGDKAGGLPGGPVCFSRGQRRRTSWRAGQRRRTSWRANLLIPGTKKEDFLKGQFASPGDKEGGLPGGPVCLSRGQRRRTGSFKTWTL